jgi:hypothetical protein
LEITDAQILLAGGGKVPEADARGIKVGDDVRPIEGIGYLCFYECCDSFNIGISIEAIGHFALARDASLRPLGFRSEIVIDPFYTVCRLIKVSPYRLSDNSVATHHIPEI